MLLKHSAVVVAVVSLHSLPRITFMTLLLYLLHAIIFVTQLWVQFLSSSLLMSSSAFALKAAFFLQPSALQGQLEDHPDCLVKNLINLIFILLVMLTTRLEGSHTVTALWSSFRHWKGTRLRVREFWARKPEFAFCVILKMSVNCSSLQV